MAEYSPPKAWFYLKKRQSMGMGTGEFGFPGRIRPDDSLEGGANTPGAGVGLINGYLYLNGYPVYLGGYPIYLGDA